MKFILQIYPMKQNSELHVTKLMVVMSMSHFSIRSYQYGFTKLS